MNVCRNCRWYYQLQPTYQLCFHPEVSAPNPVDGERHMKCTDERNNKNGKCGPEGKLFEQRRYWWQFWR